MLESAAKGFLQLADYPVLVTGASLDSGRAASATPGCLDKNGHEDLVAGSVAVINGIREGGMLDLDEVERHFQSRCRTVVRTPWDPPLEAAAETTPDDLRPATVQAHLERAAHMTRGFSGPQRRPLN